MGDTLSPVLCFVICVDFLDGLALKKADYFN